MSREKKKIKFEKLLLYRTAEKINFFNIIIAFKEQQQEH